MIRLVIVTSKEKYFERLINLRIDSIIVSSKKELLNTSFNKDTILITFNTNIIIPIEILQKIKIGYNIHAASPEFPGRDPHHWAVYYGAKRYGAVCHILTKNIDSGSIVDIEMFDVPQNISPLELLKKANISAKALIDRLISKIYKNEKICVLEGISWGKRKTKRKDLLDICKIPCNIQKEELRKRIHAFHIEGYNNIYIELEGKKFYYL